MQPSYSQTANTWLEFSETWTHKEEQPKCETPNLLLSLVIKGVLHISMNGVTPNLLEKFSPGFIFYVLSLAQTIFIHLFSQVVSYDCFFLCSLKGGVPLTQRRPPPSSKNLTSFRGGLTSIIDGQNASHFCMVVCCLHLKALCNVNCIVCISEGKTWVVEN